MFDDNDSKLDPVKLHKKLDAILQGYRKLCVSLCTHHPRVYSF